MASIPSKVADRLTAGIKRFQPVVASAKARDVNESDTVIIITDMLGEVFGYDKYSEITSEHAIRGTYCDLAIKLDGKLRLLIEVKAIGLDLKESHIKQAVDYAANQGVEWVALTNAVHWRVYKITFGQPIGHELVIDFDFLTVNSKTEANMDTLYMLTKEGLSKSVIDDYHLQRQAMSRFFLGAMMLTDAVLEVVRRELRRVTPGAKIEIEDLRRILADEVLKRDVVEGDKADDARRKITRSQGRALRTRKGGNGEDDGGEATAPTDTPATPTPAAAPPSTPKPPPAA